MKHSLRLTLLILGILACSPSPKYKDIAYSVQVDNRTTFTVGIRLETLEITVLPSTLSPVYPASSSILAYLSHEHFPVYIQANDGPFQERLQAKIQEDQPIIIVIALDPFTQEYTFTQE